MLPEKFWEVGGGGGGGGYTGRATESSDAHTCKVFMLPEKIWVGEGGGEHTAAALSVLPSFCLFLFLSTQIISSY